jgi:hypothetical protein
MGPEDLDMKDIEAVRFNHLKLSSRREGHRDYLSKDNRTNNMHDESFIVGEGQSPNASERTKNLMLSTMDSVDTQNSLAT